MQKLCDCSSDATLTNKMNIFATFLCAAGVLAQQVQQDPGLIADPGIAGPQLELVHLYYDQWPTGL